MRYQCDPAGIQTSIQVISMYRYGHQYTLMQGKSVLVCTSVVSRGRVPCPVRAPPPAFIRAVLGPNFWDANTPRTGANGPAGLKVIERGGREASCCGQPLE